MGTGIRTGAARVAGWAAAAATLLAASAAIASEEAGDASDLSSLSIEELMQLEVTSVSKRATRLSESAAAVTVITAEDIRRSGMTTIPDLLRMVPGMTVANLGNSTWAVSARGFNNQFANKLLVMIDGRTVYTPIFSGTFWDVQDVLLEDIERIEVVRGPGGTLWGANAVNGVIHVITKKAQDTQGLLVTSHYGNLEQGSGAGRWGGSLGDSFFYRGYAKYFDRAGFDDGNGGTANDEWQQAQGGFRMDWSPTEQDSFALHGDYYEGEADFTLIGLNAPDTQRTRGGNAVATYRHEFEGGADVSAKFYFDRYERRLSITRESRNTVDLELQNGLAPIRGNRVTWGLGYRATMDDLKRNTLLAFDPYERTDHYVSAFVQDEISLFEDRLRLTLGSKFERNNYTGFEYQPNARAIYLPGDGQAIWAAFSRAVRTPSRAESDVTIPNLTGNDLNIISGDAAVISEVLLAWEAGYRAQPFENLSVDIAAYYNDYDDIRTTEVLSTVPFPPGTISTSVFDNQAEATAFGFETAIQWQVLDFWRLRGSHTFMQVDVDLKSGSLDNSTVATQDDTPLHQFNLISQVDLPWNLQFDQSIYFVGEVENQDVNPYARLDLRLAWLPMEGLELALVGQNLTRSSHYEFGDGLFSPATQVPRSGYGKVTWRY